METLTFEVKGKSYTTEKIVVGKVVDLWKMRTTLSMGTYGQMYRFALQGSDSALNVIDIEAFFTVFCPEFITDIKPNSVSSLGIQDYLELEGIYVTTIKPWLDAVEDLLKQKPNV